MSNSLTWKNFREAEAKKERKTKRIALLELAVKVFMLFAVGFWAGRAAEAIARGSIF